MAEDIVIQLGLFGGHRFYAGRPFSGLAMLLLLAGIIAVALVMPGYSGTLEPRLEKLIVYVLLATIAIWLLWTLLDALWLPSMVHDANVAAGIAAQREAVEGWEARVASPPNAAARVSSPNVAVRLAWQTVRISRLALRMASSRARMRSQYCDLPLTWSVKSTPPSRSSATIHVAPESTEIASWPSSAPRMRSPFRQPSS